MDTHRKQITPPVFDPQKAVRLTPCNSSGRLSNDPRVPMLRIISHNIKLNTAAMDALGIQRDRAEVEIMRQGDYLLLKANNGSCEPGFRLHQEFHGSHTSNNWWMSSSKFNVLQLMGVQEVRIPVLEPLNKLDDKTHGTYWCYVPTQG